MVTNIISVAGRLTPSSFSKNPRCKILELLILHDNLIFSTLVVSGPPIRHAQSLLTGKWPCNVWRAEGQGYWISHFLPFLHALHSQQDGNIKEDFSTLTGMGHVTLEWLPIFHFKKSSFLHLPLRVWKQLCDDVRPKCEAESSKPGGVLTCLARWMEMSVWI